MSDDRLRERVIDSRELHAGSYLRFRLDIVADADDIQHRREIIIHPGGVAIVPLLADGRLLLVRQYRHAVTDVCLELPAGTLDRGDDGTLESPGPAAERELEEETGYRAGEWRSLGSFYTAPGFATEVMHLYLARALEPVSGYAGPAADERLELVPMAWREALDLADRGELRDAKTLVGLLRVDRLARRGEVPELAGVGAA